MQDRLGEEAQRDLHASTVYECISVSPSLHFTARFAVRRSEELRTVWQIASQRGCLLLLLCLRCSSLPLPLAALHPAALASTDARRSSR